MTKITDEFGMPIKYQEKDEKLRNILITISNVRSKKYLEPIISQINQLFSEGKDNKEERCPSCNAILKVEILDKIIRKTCGMCPYEQTENRVGKDKEVEDKC